MIAEKIPQLEKLSAKDKLLLANELWEQVEKEESTIPFDDTVAKLLEGRYEHFRQHPESAVTWDEFNASIGKN